MIPRVVAGLEAIRAGRTTPEDWTRACLDRIAARDADIRAWTLVDRDGAIERSRKVRPDRPLAGLPIGVKDVIDVAGLETGCNSPIEAGRIADASAGAVARLTDAGAVVLGKTVTTEFAFLEPGPTRNPRDLARTPGGSSSGSAAAVADGHVPIALTTQTGGSTIRPAAYCGVVGYKPPFGLVPAEGLMFLAPSLDVIGLHGLSVADVAQVAEILEARSLLTTMGGAPRFVRVRLPLEDQAEPGTQEAMKAAVAALRGAGAQVREIGPIEALSPLDAAHRVVMAIEVAREFTSTGRIHDHRLSRSLSAFAARGVAETAETLSAAQSAVARAKMALFPFAEAGEVLLSPSAPGEAPVGLTTTGTSIFNRLWSLLHLGVITVPAGRGPNGLPLGLQIVDPRPDGEHLFKAAAFAEAALAANNYSRAGDTP